MVCFVFVQGHILILERSMVIPKMLVWLLLLVSAATWAQTPNAVAQVVTDRQKIQSATETRRELISPTQARLVIYRAQEDGLAGSTSVFINGAYHTTLGKGTFREDCFAPGNIEVRLRQTRAGERGQRPLTTVTEMPLPAGRSTYLRLRAQDGEPVPDSIAEAQAEKELADKAPQQRTLSRVAQSCIEDDRLGDATRPPADKQASQR